MKESTSLEADNCHHYWFTSCGTSTLTVHQFTTLDTILLTISSSSLSIIVLQFFSVMTQIIVKIHAAHLYESENKDHNTIY